MGAEGSRAVEGIRALGTGARATGARATGAVVGGAEGIGGGTDEAGAEGSSMYSAIGDRSPCGLSVAGSSLFDPGGGR